MDDTANNVAIPVITAPTEPTSTPIDPKTYRWKLGDPNVLISTKVDFEWCPITYSLKVVKPVTFEELTALTQNAVKQSGEDIFKHLFAAWYQSLKEIGLTDQDSFKAASIKARKG